MTDGHNLPPLPPDVNALLDAERRRPAPDADVLGRIAAGIAARLDLPLPPEGGDTDGGAGDAGGDGGAPAGEGGLDAGNAASGAAHAGASVTSGGAGLMAAVLKPVTLIAFGVGVVAGAGGLAVMQSSTPSPVVVQQPAVPEPVAVPAPVPAAVPVPVPEPAPPAERIAERTKTAPRARAKRPHAPDAAERQLIEMARVALTRGRPADALAALGQHRAKYRRGELIEEREALSVIALAATGKTEVARARATRFRRRYPRSLLLPSVQAAVKRLP